MNVMEARRRTLGGGIYEKTASGETILANGSLARRYPGLHLYGQSTQESTTGAQLLNYLSIEGSSISGNATATIDDDGYINISGNGNNSVTRFNISPHIPIGEYTISVDNPIDITFGLTSDNGDYANGIGISIGNTSASKTTAEEVTQLAFSTAGKGEFSYKLKIMLNAGSAALPWEPYTGGAPSPSPDYPQEIVSKAEDGNVEVEVLCGNLWSKQKDVEFERVTKFYLDAPIPEGKCTFSAVVHSTYTDANQCLIMFDLKNGNSIYYNIDRSTENERTNVVITLESPCTAISFYASTNNSISSGDTASFTDIMLNYGDTPLPYEPYKTPQTLIISTPNGLPGIPVTSGGNYTDETGQQWVCDEVDFKRGVYVQRVKKASDITWHIHTGYAVEGSELFSTNDITDGIIDGNTTANVALCSKIPYDSRILTFNITGFYQGYDSVFARIKDVSDTEEFNQLMSGAEILYKLQTPVETPLTQAELSAYAGLHTNYPTTTVSNDDGVYMSLDYKTKKSLEVN